MKNFAHHFAEHFLQRLGSKKIFRSHYSYREFSAEIQLQKVSSSCIDANEYKISDTYYFWRNCRDWAHRKLSVNIILAILILTENSLQRLSWQKMSTYCVDVNDWNFSLHNILAENILQSLGLQSFRTVSNQNGTQREQSLVWAVCQF